MKVRSGITFLGLSSAPSDPQNGDTYYDTTLNKLRTYENGAWEDVVGGGGGGGGLYDIAETSFSGANNQSSAANVTGFAFANANVRAFEALVSIYVNATTPLFESIRIHGIQKGSEWQISQSVVGDNSLVGLSITTSGQIQYTSSNYTGFTALTIKFRATALSV